MKIQMTPIGKIKPNPNNPRTIDTKNFDKLVESIKEFPEMLELRPIVLNEDMIALGGNMRYKAAKVAGLKEVPTMSAEHLTPEQQTEFIIKDNLGFGEWDWQMIAADWNSEDLEEWGLDISGFQHEEHEYPEDIEEILDFNESINFIIKCSSIEQLEELKEKLKCDSSKLNYDDFIIKTNL